MSVSIRLRRGGAKKRPFYRIVAANTSSPRDGRFVEILGYYHPLDEPVTVKVDQERVKRYLESGARVSPTVESLLMKQGIAVPKKVSKPKDKAKTKARNARKSKKPAAKAKAKAKAKAEKPVKAKVTKKAEKAEAE